MDPVNFGLNTAMKVLDVVKIKRGNGGKVIRQYVDDVPDLANPVARVVRTQPHLRQRVMANKKVYKRKGKYDHDPS